MPIMQLISATRGEAMRMADRIGDWEQKILLGVGSAAAAAALFAPFSYRGRGVLSGIAATANLIARLLGFFD